METPTCSDNNHDINVRMILYGCMKRSSINVLFSYLTYIYVMNRLMIIYFVPGCLFFSSMLFGQSTYEWLGSLQHYNGHTFIRLKKTENYNRLTHYGYISEHWKITHEIKKENHWEFSSTNGIDQMDCTLTSGNAENEFNGTCQQNNISYKINLELRQSLDEEQFDPYLGYYKNGQNEIFIVRKNQGTLHLLSPISGEFVVLKYLGDDRFYSRTGEYYSFRGTDVLKSELNWHGINGQIISASRFIPFEIEEVTIFTRHDTLRGSLYLPNHQNNTPAMLLALGAGRFDRYAYAMEAEIMAAYGIASLVVDFPGTGKSSGNLHDNTFQMKSDMTVDMHKFLQNHSRIDPSRVGIRGGSQSGRIALMAAAQSADVAAVISVNVPIQTQKETQLYAINQFLRMRGYSEDINVQVTNIWRQYFDQIIHGAIDTNLLLELRTVLKHYPEIYLPNPPTTALPRSPHAENLTSDPAPLLSKINCPILYQLSKLDERVPYASSINNINKALSENPALKFDIISYEFADHSLMLPGYQIVQGLFMDKIIWLKKHL